MTDLTQGSVRRHLVNMATPMMIGMLVQGLYLFVDMYFVAGIGPAAVAAVGAGSALMFLVLALTQMLSVGTVSLIARATGAADHAYANQVFRQSMLLAGFLTALTLLAGFLLQDFYLQTVSTDAAVREAGAEFLQWYLPGLALAFVSTAIGSALRAVGVVKPAMAVQLLTVLLNLILAPVLISGWGTGLALGVAGAGLASTLASAVGVLLLWVYFRRCQHQVLDTSAGWSLQLPVWRRLLAIGLPAGGEYALMFLFTAFVYWVIRDLGTEVQAAFGIGMRIIQAVSLPVVALSFAIPAIAGQNLGAGLHARVHQTLRAALQLSFGLMLLIFLFSQFEAEMLMRWFTADAAVVLAGVVFIKIISWNYLTSAVVLTCSGMFQALGNTWPSLLSSAVRLALFVLPVLWLSQQPDFTPTQVWWCSALSVLVQGLLSFSLLQWQLKKMPTPELMQQ
ncbi:MATE family efflux transporter [Rheinheimera texasensis]|uniref:MATE family efflux transporter n=1 Tax=Rheinheimera texasensis TaxID=306205 RepID=UPI000560F609|nr:MATE family efflux transporter [Rheinheimera texasensis]